MSRLLLVTETEKTNRRYRETTHLIWKHRPFHHKFLFGARKYLNRWMEDLVYFECFPTPTLAKTQITNHQKKPKRLSRMGSVAQWVKVHAEQAWPAAANAQIPQGKERTDS